MKGALSSKPNYQFDAEGHLVKAAEDEPDEATFLRESIVLYAEGHSGNHPADVAASNAPEEPPPPEALAVGGKRQVFSESELANDSEDPDYDRPTTMDEDRNATHSEDVVDESGSGFGTKRGRRNKSSSPY